MDIDGIKELALQHGVVILDYEDKTTLRMRIAAQLGVDAEAVADSDLERVTDAFSGLTGNIPLLSELDGANEAIDDAVRGAMVDVGMLPEAESEED